MGDFMRCAQAVRTFSSNADTCLINVGYNDFEVVKPAFTYRVQNYTTWHIILSGSGTLDINGKKYSLHGGDSFFIPSDVLMRYYPDKEDPWEYVWFALKSDQCVHHGELMGFSAEKPIRHLESLGEIRRVLKELFERIESGGDSYFLAVSAFYRLLDICTFESPQTEIETIKRNIDQAYMLPDFSVEELCHNMGISHAHLLRLFKKKYGTTISRYVIKKRVERGAELLEGTALSVKSVAYSCGFSDEVHFMKTFKRIMGCTAGEYREKADK